MRFVNVNDEAPFAPRSSYEHGPVFRCLKTGRRLPVKLLLLRDLEPD